MSEYFGKTRQQRLEIVQNNSDQYDPGYRHEHPFRRPRKPQKNNHE